MCNACYIDGVKRNFTGDPKWVKLHLPKSDEIHIKHCGICHQGSISQAGPEVQCCCSEASGFVTYKTCGQGVGVKQWARYFSRICNIEGLSLKESYNICKKHYK